MLLQPYFLTAAVFLTVLALQGCGHLSNTCDYSKGDYTVSVMRIELAGKSTFVVVDANCPVVAGIDKLDMKRAAHQLLAPNVAELGSCSAFNDFNNRNIGKLCQAVEILAKNKNNPESLHQWLKANPAPFLAKAAEALVIVDSKEEALKAQAQGEQMKTLQGLLAMKDQQIQQLQKNNTRLQNDVAALVLQKSKVTQEVFILKSANAVLSNKWSEGQSKVDLSLAAAKELKKQLHQKDQQLSDMKKMINFLFKNNNNNSTSLSGFASRLVSLNFGSKDQVDSLVNDMTAAAEMLMLIGEINNVVDRVPYGYKIFNEQRLKNINKTLELLKDMTKKNNNNNTDESIKKINNIIKADAALNDSMKSAPAGAKKEMN